VFDNCYSLASVDIPDSVTSIGSIAFATCTSLASVVIPDSVISIDSIAFPSCFGFGLELSTNNNPRGQVQCLPCDQSSIQIPDSVTSIGSHAFQYCEGLASVVIGDSVTAIMLSDIARIWRQRSSQTRSHPSATMLLIPVFAPKIYMCEVRPCVIVPLELALRQHLQQHL